VKFLEKKCFFYKKLQSGLTHRVGIQYQKMSAESIQNQLLHVKLSILKHKETEKIYAIPSKITQEIKQIYWLMNKKISDVPYEIK
jgi:hypothetical protein